MTDIIEQDDRPYTIISGFPGVGKTYFCENNDNALDSDSSSFSWIIAEDGEKERNPDFPNNYIEHIKKNMYTYKYIFVSSHKEVRDALTTNQLSFYLVYPDKACKQEYIDRYNQRGNDLGFIKLLEMKWDDWVEECSSYKSLYCKKLDLTKGETISSIIKDIAVFSLHSVATSTTINFQPTINLVSGVDITASSKNSPTMFNNEELELIKQCIEFRLNSTQRSSDDEKIQSLYIKVGGKC